MPLHNIPLCDFTYARDFFITQNLFFDVENLINLNNNIKFVSNDTDYDIDIETKLYTLEKNINKIIDISNYKYVASKYKSNINICDYKYVSSFLKSNINLSKNNLFLQYYLNKYVTIQDCKMINCKNEFEATKEDYLLIERYDIHCINILKAIYIDMFFNSLINISKLKLLNRLDKININTNKSNLYTRSNISNILLHKTDFYNRKFFKDNININKNMNLNSYDFNIDLTKCFNINNNINYDIFVNKDMYINKKFFKDNININKAMLLNRDLKEILLNNNSKYISKKLLKEKIILSNIYYLKNYINSNIDIKNDCLYLSNLRKANIDINKSIFLNNYNKDIVLTTDIKSIINNSYINVTLQNNKNYYDINSIININNNSKYYLDVTNINQILLSNNYYLNDTTAIDIQLNNLKLFNCIKTKKQINILDTTLRLNKLINTDIIIDKSSLFFNKDNYTLINKDLLKFYEKTNIVNIVKDNNIKLNNVITKTNIVKNNLSKSLNINSNIKITKDNYKLYAKNSVKEIIKNNSIKNIVNIKHKNITLNTNLKFIAKTFKSIMLNKFEKLNMINNKIKISNFNNKKLFIKDKINIVKNNRTILLQKDRIDVYKQTEKLLENYAINIFLQSANIYDDYNYINIALNDRNKYLKVVKRWWWLPQTEYKDHIIIPNTDYKYNTNQLNNNNFEYIRFTDHSMIWGKDWGIDYDVEPIGVSIEKITQLINIVIMIWYHNAERWLHCTGKEGIQFLNELLYDWYNLETSKPDNEYYRLFRFIRWYSEKIYFKDYETGLEAIYNLILELIKYMKIHHYDVLLIHENIKNMDEYKYPRFVKEVDKIKGKRFYLLEEKRIKKK